MTINQSTAKLLNDLLRELSSELDLHYEDSDLHAIKQTMDVMTAAAHALSEGGHATPEVYHHMLKRFEQNQLPR